MYHEQEKLEVLNRNRKSKNNNPIQCDVTGAGNPLSETTKTSERQLSRREMWTASVSVKTVKWG